MQKQLPGRAETSPFPHSQQCLSFTSCKINSTQLSVGLSSHVWLFVHSSSCLLSPQLFPFSLSSHVRVRHLGQQLGLSKGLFEKASESLGVGCTA